MIFDGEDVANLVRSKFGASKSEVDCPYCGFRWGLIAVSDLTGWITCLVPPEGVDDVYKAFDEARNIGLSVNAISGILDRLVAKVRAEK